jgi:hypothetical protein
VKSTTVVDTGYYVSVIEEEREREQGRFETNTYLVKSTTGVDTGCYVSVAKGERERERKGGLKYIPS